LPVVPAAVAVAASTFFMISMTGRFVPAMAMITSSVEASAVAQFSAALAAAMAAWVIHDGANHQLVIGGAGLPTPVFHELEQATGVNRSGLYAEFKDKEELFVQSLRYYLS
jgi:hypothetical protein